MTGAELKKTLFQIQSAEKSYYHTSGLSQQVTLNPSKKLVSVKLIDDTEIIDTKVYNIGSIDFLLNGGDDFKLVAEWYKGVNVDKSFGLLRDHMVEYVKTKADYIKTNDYIDPLHKRINIITANNFRTLQ